MSRCRVEFDRPAGVVTAETEDLSPHGLFVRTEALLPVGEVSEVRVTLPDGQLLRLLGRVAHMLTPSAAKVLGRHAGMGFELVGPDGAARLKLRAYVDGLTREATSPGLVGTVHVVVVEPAAPLRARMGRALEAGGFKVSAVESATEALGACSAWRPDAIVAAAAMEGMTGVDLAYAMSEHTTLADVPLVLTGDESDLSRLEAYRAGVRDFIPRPFLDEELLIRMHRVAAPVMTASPGVRGGLVDIGLGTLLSLFEFERKSGVLLLLRGGELARVFFREGRMLKFEASAGHGAPKDRLMAILDWTEGQFEFSPSTIAGTDELNLSVTALLLEHARTRDEAATPAGRR